jgi:glycosyltransferase involved in cell wall biosynthesis
MLHRGFGRHTRCLVKALLEIDTQNKYIFFAEHAAVSELPSHCDVRTIGRGGILRRKATGARSIGALIRASWAMSAESLDVIVFPAVYSFVPVLTRAKVILVLHDTTAEALPIDALHNRVARMLWNAKVKLGRWQADSLIAVSGYAQRQLSDYFNIPGERIQVVGEAPGPQFRVLDVGDQTGELLKYGVRPGRRVIVHVGGFSPHKNLAHLVREYAALIANQACGDVDLILVGDYREDTFHSCYEELTREVARLGLAERVIFAGYVPDEELVRLLNMAAILVMPSLNEGFGLPAVEAAACGCPVIATTASPLPSLLGDGALYVDPRALGELRVQMQEILSSAATRDRLREKGLAAAARLDWKLEARKLLRIINMVADR